MRTDTECIGLFLLCLELIMGRVEVFRGVSGVYLGIKIGCHSDILG